MSIPVLTLAGSPAAMGRAHGAAHANAIRDFAQERILLAGDPAWSGRGLERAKLLDLAGACLEAHERYDAGLLAELAGMAEATGASVAELIVAGGFTDFIDAVYNHPEAVPAAPAGADDCTAFLVPNARSAGGQGMLGQTWDMHVTATDHVLLIDGRPDDGPRFLAFTTAGCVGMIGMNEHGIAVGITNLLGADGGVGVTWPFVIRKVLAQRELEAALACITDAELAGAHNYLLMGPDGRGYNIEAFRSETWIEHLDGEALVHTNHCLVPATQRVQREREAVSQAASEQRLEVGRRMLESDALTPDDLMAVTRNDEAICVSPTPPKDVATCGAVVMRPATRELWAVQGLPSERPYTRFQLA